MSREEYAKCATRDEAAAYALAASDVRFPDIRAIHALAAADAHDAARGIHRVAINAKTVERVARALHDRIRSQAACSCCFTAWEDASERTRESYRDDARAVLAAAVEAGQ
ncbi:MULTISPECIES: hypothetical protein [Arthrobacter]|uniref:Uncharacterized protein n=1 Tax=Arthrobacter terricola TaxID=2547396 RepID=A0A4R5KMN0_9MICC|nr:MULTISPECIES: hypothetical protein [Arthrobacter]MBT8161019.1 hypothetical protein [Arthrobacter sp. GN70]TDF96883.1 hypothetical protein E1809_09170 [Arthrobacter terricola]